MLGLLAGNCICTIVRRVVSVRQNLFNSIVKHLAEKVVTGVFRTHSCQFIILLVCNLVGRVATPATSEFISNVNIIVIILLAELSEFRGTLHWYSFEMDHVRRLNTILREG